MAPPTPSASHKPRRRRKGEDAIPYTENHGSMVVHAASRNLRPAFPLVSFLWPAKGTVSQWTTLPLILMAVGLFRWSTALWGYSGYQSPPMHGDFEAQRHWMEVTTWLPVSYWYFHDLEWWGLDYPPLTAYHSWLLGKIGGYIDPAWFTLYQSRGLDDPSLKVFMRASVFVSEYFVYIPAAVILLRHYSRQQGVNPWESSLALVAILMQPATILIDHGHFQYNTVMLGFVLASISSMLAGRLLWSCIFFVASLGFKQMALFYAPAVFAYLLGVCITPRINITRFLSIALITVISFALLFAPLILGTLYDYSRTITATKYPEPPLLASLPIRLDKHTWYYQVVLQLAQSIHRIFPFARGLFEDKVANAWCAIHTFHKLHRYSSAFVQRAALLATAAAITPPCFVLLLKPRKDVILPAFAATSWAFFLFSYQVHEKNVLLPLLPMTFLLGGNGGMQPSIRAWVGLANILGCWTMFPLLKRDELRVPYTVITLLWAYLLGLPPTGISLYWSDRAGSVTLLTKLLHFGLYGAMIVWHVAEAFITPPQDKPDLWVVLNVLVGAAGFGLCYLWCVWITVQKSGLLKEWSSAEGKGKEKAKTL